MPGPASAGWVRAVNTLPSAAIHGSSAGTGALAIFAVWNPAFRIHSLIVSPRRFTSSPSLVKESMFTIRSSRASISGSLSANQPSIRSFHSASSIFGLLWGYAAALRLARKSSKKGLSSTSRLTPRMMQATGLV